MVSKYNVSVCTPNGDLIIKNTLTKETIGVRKDKVVVVKEILEHPELYSTDNDPIVNILYNKGFIVDSNTQEAQQIERTLESEINNSRLELTIIPTNACNFDCIYCYQKEPYFFMNNETVNKVLSFLDKNITQYSGLLVTFFGGEPLLAKELVIELMDKIRTICKKHRKPLYASITTNGYELDAYTFEQLIKGHMRFFQITIDGPRDIHNRQRPHKTKTDSFDKIINNLLEIKEKYSRHKFLIALRINITSKLFPYFEDFLNWLESCFGDDNHFTIVWEFVRDWGGDKIDNNRDLFFDHDDAKYMFNILSESKFSINGNLAQSDSGLYLCTASKKNGYVVNHDGKIYKCSMALENEEYKHINCIGHINEDGTLFIDTQKEKQWIGRNKVDSKCIDCQNYPDCMGMTCPFSSRIRNKKVNCDELFIDTKLQLLNLKADQIEYI